MATRQVQIKRVFISSTIYDLGRERALIKRLLESYRNPNRIRFECLASDRPDFPISPFDRATKHSYDICIDNVAKCDYFVLLIRKRYGAPIVEHDGEKISITHREFREAQHWKIPRFVLIDSRTWDAKHQRDTGKAQTFVPDTQVGVFGLIDEIRRLPMGNWIDFFASQTEISATISTFLTTFDDSQFIGDINVPQGSRIRTNERFTKTWEIMNSGLRIWKDRFLREDNPTASGLVPVETTVPIPVTFPGQKVRVSVEFIAPRFPGTCESYWKMVDKDRNYCFPHKAGLTCCVKVI